MPENIIDILCSCENGNFLTKFEVDDGNDTILEISPSKLVSSRDDYISGEYFTKFEEKTYNEEKDRDRNEDTSRSIFSHYDEADSLVVERTRYHPQTKACLARDVFYAINLDASRASIVFPSYIMRMAMDDSDDREKICFISRRFGKIIMVKPTLLFRLNNLIPNLVANLDPEPRLNLKELEAFINDTIKFVNNYSRLLSIQLRLNAQELRSLMQYPIDCVISQESLSEDIIETWTLDIASNSWKLNFLSGSCIPAIRDLLLPRLQKTNPQACSPEVIQAGLIAAKSSPILSPIISTFTKFSQSILKYDCVLEDAYKSSYIFRVSNPDARWKRIFLFDFDDTKQYNTFPFNSDAIKSLLIDPKRSRALLAFVSLEKRAIFLLKPSLLHLYNSYLDSREENAAFLTLKDEIVQFLARKERLSRDFSVPVEIELDVCLKLMEHVINPGSSVLNFMDEWRKPHIGKWEIDEKTKEFVLTDTEPNFWITRPHSGAPTQEDVVHQIDSAGK